MILTVTLNPAVDHTVEVDSLPAPDRISRANDARVDPGGKGINVSKYLVELGAETVATGVVGDFLGEFVRNSLADGQVNGDFVEIDGQTRLNTTILTEDAEFKINHNGPTVSECDIDDLLDTVKHNDPETVVVGGSLPPGLGPDAIDRIAQAGNWETVVDVGGDCLRELDASYALCKPNREELAAATGQPVRSLKECSTAVEQLRHMGYDRIVASLGDDGAIMSTPNECFHAEALDAEVVDTVGAGDSLLAGILSALNRGASDREALQAGMAVASRIVSVPGTEIPSLDNVASMSVRVPISTQEAKSG